MRNKLLNYLRKGQKGFTLIELLIVIAILGILATSVLVALDPVEQMNRGRDAGKINSISQLGKAVQAYYTVQSIYPTAGGNWQQRLLTASEIKQSVNAPTASAGQCGVNRVNNICYTVDVNGNAKVWTILDAKANKVKANNCASVIAAVWLSNQGKSGIDCIATVGTEPGIGDTLY